MRLQAIFAVTEEKRDISRENGVLRGLAKSGPFSHHSW
jgi:hypothetical protein